MVGKWNKLYEGMKEDDPAYTYAGDLTVKKGTAFLDDPQISTIEDWGCGGGGVKNYVAAHQKYVGVDGSKGCPNTKVIADLRTYKSNVDAVFMRHVLEHNRGWEFILKNALRSFQKKMVIIIFTPFQQETKVIHQFAMQGQTFVDIGFNPLDLERIIKEFPNVTYRVESGISSPETSYKVEHMIYFERVQDQGPVGSAIF